MPDYNYHFERDDLGPALACLDEHGFCVIRGMIDQEMVAALKASIDRHLDPGGDLGPASNRYHMTFGIRTTAGTSPVPSAPTTCSTASRSPAAPGSI